MIDNRITKSNLFLIELIIVIMFFAFASTITLQVFFKANEKSADSTALNGALMVTQAAAEKAKSITYTDLNKIAETEYFDENWNPSNVENAKYTLNTKIKTETKNSGIMVTLTYKAKSSTETIYELKSKKYFPNEERQIL
ncbi:type II secretion system protein [Anaerovorax odorimutans]|uniref:type II secretion system protein n=1 Tax=Anaerovorax odorimutans TaxID=109327 RepID=UPI0003FB6A6B|nr:type II secretion system protein [Anaerovorax odorimutans]